MRLAALLVASLFTTVGCAASSADDSGAASSDLGAVCSPAMYYDDEIVVYTDYTYAPRQLHVTEERITPANPSSSVDWEGSRFHESHVEYVLTPRVTDAVIARARAAVGGAISPATITMTTSGASVQTLVTAGTTSFTAVGDSLVVELTDKFEGTLAPGSGPVIGASLRKSLLLTARANAKAGGCDIGLMSASPVAFDVSEAKVLVPGFEMATIDQFLAFSNTYRAGHLKSTLDDVSPAADAAARDFSDYIEREVRPLTKGLSTLSHDELVTKLEAAWDAVRAYAHVVLAETHSTVDENQFVAKRDDGTWGLTPGVKGLAVMLLSIAETAKTDLEGSIRDTNGGWTTKPLLP